jgi:hypothetical protein
MPAILFPSSLGPDEAAAGSLASGPVADLNSSSGARIKLGRAAPHASLCSFQQAGDAKDACASMGRLRLTYWRHSFRRAQYTVE